MKNIFKLLSVIIPTAFAINSQAQCSGTYTSTGANCQTITLGTGVTGFVEVCLDVNNIPPSGGGNNCSPGCGYTGGGYAPRIYVQDSGGNNLWTWTSTSTAGGCFVVPVNNGIAIIEGLCLDAGTVISWDTVDSCGQSVCAGPTTCNSPYNGNCDCSNPCGPACGFTTAPVVSTVTGTCPEYTYYPTLGTAVTSSSCYTFVANNTTVDFNVIINSNCGAGNVSGFAFELYETGSCGSTVLTGGLADLSMNPLVIGQSYTFCYTFTTPGCYHTAHWPYFVGAVPLTVELIDFSSKANDSEIELIWNIKEENNTDSYILEKSADGKNFSEIGTYMATGGSEPSKYVAYDRSPLDGVNYYRLRSVDTQGNVYDLGIASSQFASPDSFVADEVYVYDVTGSLIRTATFEEGIYGSNVVRELNLDEGVYMIKMFNRFGESRSAKRIVTK